MVTMIIVFLEVTQDNGLGVPVQVSKGPSPRPKRTGEQLVGLALPCQSYHRTFAMDSFDPTIFFFCLTDIIFTYSLNSQKKDNFEQPKINAFMVKIGKL